MKVNFEEKDLVSIVDIDLGECFIVGNSKGVFIKVDVEGTLNLKPNLNFMFAANLLNGNLNSFEKCTKVKRVSGEVFCKYEQ